MYTYGLTLSSIIGIEPSRTLYMNDESEQELTMSATRIGTQSSLFHVKRNRRVLLVFQRFILLPLKNMLLTTRIYFNFLLLLPIAIAEDLPVLPGYHHDRSVYQEQPYEYWFENRPFPHTHGGEPNGLLHQHYKYEHHYHAEKEEERKSYILYIIQTEAV